MSSKIVIVLSLAVSIAALAGCGGKADYSDTNASSTAPVKTSASSGPAKAPQAAQGQLMPVPSIAQNNMGH